ncbi:SAG-related sequence SRS44 [Toxoplasma gondii GT1]|nr:SAG-related sequence SRS44 [Toxoplasma gondii GT1]KFG42439.1 SAG-related sequence SRS44 [Toxoplasma gondii FOU]
MKKIEVIHGSEGARFECPVESVLLPEQAMSGDIRAATVFAVAADGSCNIFDPPSLLGDVVPGAYLQEELSVNADKAAKTYTLVIPGLPAKEVKLCYVCAHPDNPAGSQVTVITVRRSGDSENGNPASSPVCRPSFSLEAWALGVRQPSVVLDVAAPGQSVRFSCLSTATELPSEAGARPAPAQVYPVNGRGWCDLSKGPSSLEKFLLGAAMTAEVRQRGGGFLTTYTLNVPRLPSTNRRFCYVCPRNRDPADGCAVLVKVRGGMVEDPIGKPAAVPTCHPQESPEGIAAGTKSAALILDIVRPYSSVKFACPNNSEVLPHNAVSDDGLKASVFAVRKDGSCIIGEHTLKLQDVVPGATLTGTTLVDKGSVTRVYTFFVGMLPTRSQKVCYVCARNSLAPQGCGVVISVKGKENGKPAKVSVCEPQYLQGVAERGLLSPSVELLVDKPEGVAQFVCPGNSVVFPEHATDESPGIATVYQASNANACDVWENPVKLDDVLQGATLRADTPDEDTMMAKTYTFKVPALPSTETKLCYACVRDGEIANSCGVMITVKPKGPTTEEIPSALLERGLCLPVYSTDVAKTGLRRPSVVLKVDKRNRVVEFTCPHSSLVFPDQAADSDAGEAVVYTVSGGSCDVWENPVYLTKILPGASLVSETAVDASEITTKYTFTVKQLPKTPKKLCYLCVYNRDVMNSCGVLIDVSSNSMTRLSKTSEEGIHTNPTVPTTLELQCPPDYSARTAATGLRLPEMELLVDSVNRTARFVCPDDSSVFPEIDGEADPASGKVYRMTGDSCDTREETAFLQDEVPGAELQRRTVVDGGVVQRYYIFKASRLPEEDKKLCFLCVRQRNPADSCAVMITVKADSAAAVPIHPFRPRPAVKLATYVCKPENSTEVAETGLKAPALSLTIDSRAHSIQFICPESSIVFPDLAAVPDQDSATVYLVGEGGSCNVAASPRLLSDVLPGATLGSRTTVDEGVVNRTYTLTAPKLPEEDVKLCYLCVRNRQIAESCGIHITVKGTKAESVAKPAGPICSLGYSPGSEKTGMREAAIELVVEDPSTPVRFICPEGSYVFPEYATSTDKGIAAVYGVKGNECIFAGPRENLQSLVPGATLRMEAADEGGTVMRTYTFTTPEQPAEDRRFCYMCVRERDIYQSCPVIIVVKGSGHLPEPKAQPQEEHELPVCTPHEQAGTALTGLLDPSVKLWVNEPEEQVSFVCPDGSAVLPDQETSEPQVYAVGAGEYCLVTKPLMSLAKAVPSASLSTDTVVENEVTTRKYTLRVPSLPLEETKLCYTCVSEVDPAKKCGVSVTVKGEGKMPGGLTSSLPSPVCAAQFSQCAFLTGVRMPSIMLTVHEPNTKLVFDCPPNTALYPQNAVVPGKATFFPLNEKGACIYKGPVAESKLYDVVPGARLRAKETVDGAVVRSYTLTVSKLPKKETRLCYLCVRGDEPAYSCGVIVKVKAPAPAAPEPKQLPVCVPSSDPSVGKMRRITPKLTLKIEKPGGSASFECPDGSTIFPDHADALDPKCVLAYKVVRDTCDLRGPTEMVASKLQGAYLTKTFVGTGYKYTFTVPHLPAEQQQVCFMCVMDRDTSRSCGVVINVMPHPAASRSSVPECKLKHVPAAATTGLREASLILNVREPSSVVEFGCPRNSVIMPSTATSSEHLAQVYSVRDRHICDMKEFLRPLADLVPGASLKLVHTPEDGDTTRTHMFRVGSLPVKDTALCYLCVDPGDHSHNCGVVINVKGSEVPPPPKDFGCAPSHSEEVERTGKLSPAVRLMVTSTKEPIRFECRDNAKVYPPAASLIKPAKAVVYPVSAGGRCIVGKPPLSLNRVVPGAKLKTKAKLVTGAITTTGFVFVPVLPSIQKDFCFACVDRGDITNSCGVLVTVPPFWAPPVQETVCNDVKTLTMTVHSPGSVTLRCGLEFPKLDPPIDDPASQGQVYYGKSCGDVGALRTVIPGASVVKEPFYHNLAKEVAVGVTLTVPASIVKQTICFKCRQPDPLQHETCTVRVTVLPPAAQPTTTTTTTTTTTIKPTTTTTTRKPTTTTTTTRRPTTTTTTTKKPTTTTTTTRKPRTTTTTTTKKPTTTTTTTRKPTTTTTTTRKPTTTTTTTKKPTTTTTTTKKPTTTTTTTTTRKPTTTTTTTKKPTTTTTTTKKPTTTTTTTKKPTTTTTTTTTKKPTTTTTTTTTRKPTTTTTTTTRKPTTTTTTNKPTTTTTTTRTPTTTTSKPPVVFELPSEFIEETATTTRATISLRARSAAAPTSTTTVGPTTPATSLFDWSSKVASLAGQWSFSGALQGTAGSRSGVYEAPITQLPPPLLVPFKIDCCGPPVIQKGCCPPPLIQVDCCRPPVLQQKPGCCCCGHE